MPERQGKSQGAAGAPVPEFVAEEQEFSCGYAPRSMEYSLRSDALFVGCKDGTITIVESLAGRTLQDGSLERTLRCSRTSGQDPLRGGRGLAVRKVCEWSADWLLVARDDGRIDLLNWRQAREERCEKPPLVCLWPGTGDGTAYETNPVTYMDWLDRSRLLVSFRNTGTRIVECREAAPGASIADAARESFAAALPTVEDVLGLCCSVPIEPGRRWLWLSENGTVRVAYATPQGISLEPPIRVWPAGEMPGFISDFAVIKPPDDGTGREGQDDFDYRDQESLGAYVSTDNGVYLLDWDDAMQPRAQRISLPGVGRMCMAITYYADRTDAFLWVSDSAGDAHLFWDERGSNAEDRSHRFRPNWRRSGIRHDASQVILAYASWRTLDGHFVVGQARRNDRVVISLYKVQLLSPSTGGDLSLRGLLRRGTVDDLQRRLEKEDPEVRDWRPEALLAELFEQLGESREEMKTLREFLGNPNAELARSVLRKLPRKEPDEMGPAVELWTHALLGTIHRYGQGDGESLYLGVIRWLRAIAEACPEQTPQAERIRRAVERQIMFARKWGVFGASYAIRSSAAESLRILAEQKQKARDLDHFAYRSLLFQRQVDLELADDQGQRLGRTAWDLQVLHVGERVLVAVSWIWGDIELYEVVRPESRAQGEGYRLELCVMFAPKAAKGLYRLRAKNLKSGVPAARSEPRDYGHSRALVLGRFPGDGGYYLLASPAQRPEPGLAHSVELWRLDLGKKRVKATTSEALARHDLRSLGEGQESVYSLLEIEPGWVVAGLRGHGGIAQVTLVEVSGGVRPALRCVVPQEKLAAASPEGKAIARNRVWCLVKDEESSSRGCHQVYAGCEDGQVWRLEVPRRDPALRDGSLQPTLVGRLGTPVWALACRTSRQGENGVRRIFVGGADGTIAAWQQSSPDEKNPRFTTVWATWEQGSPIAQLHILELATGTPGGVSYPSVLALTQQGRGVLFADRVEVQETGSRPEHHRLRVPGERYARFELRAAVFASGLLDLPRRFVSGSREKAFARLAVATNEGRLQIHTLHYPRYLPERRAEYEQLVETWLGMVCQGRDEATGSFGPFRNQRLRMAEAAYVASPVAPQVLVRGILQAEEAGNWNAVPLLQSLDRQWLPRHLRPLLDLDRAWNRLDARGVEKALDQALERVFRVRDNNLFVEIVAVVLDRANRWLFRNVEPVAPIARVREVYQGLLRSLERGLEHWQGTSYRTEVRIRINYAKQLIDGDTLWRLCLRSGEPAIDEILKSRIASIRRLLVAGDPLLALETLRATNLSLIRSCKRWVEDGSREVAWTPDDPRQEAPWEGLEEYVKALSDFATQASHSAERVNDSVTHEIARSLALIVCACPSAAIRVAHWMSEAGLVSQESPREDRAAAVLDQLALLGALGVPVPDAAVQLFRRTGSGRREDSLNVEDPFWKGLLPQSTGRLWPRSRLRKVVGRHNQQVLQEMILFSEILRWLHSLVRQLSRDASGIDLQRARKLLHRLKHPGGGDDSFRHSRQLWLPVFESFERDVLGKIPFRERSDHVRPEVVLLSRDIHQWCRSSLGRLDEYAQRHRIFQPQYSLYRTALFQLQRAAEAFPQSTAIQKNIVLGILGHGLLESLDEHVLELEEIAQALDPLLVWKHRGEGRPQKVGRGGNSRAERFATYLLERSRDAESIPKNLRTLQGLLDPGRLDQEGAREVTFRHDLLRDFWPEPSDRGPHPERTPSRPNPPGWTWHEDDRGEDIPLRPRELRFLRMTLKELDQNDRNYGPDLSEREEDHWPRVLIQSGETRPGAILRFALRPEAPDSENRKRLKDLETFGLQKLMPRREARDVASHGTGLYLANLAAAVVGWQLSIHELPGKEHWFSFLLERVPEVTP